MKTRALALTLLVPLWAVGCGNDTSNGSPQDSNQPPPGTGGTDGRGVLPPRVDASSAPADASTPLDMKPPAPPDAAPDGGTPPDSAADGPPAAPDAAPQVDSAPPTPDGAAGNDQTCDQFATGFCQKLGTCSPFYITVGYGDVATCTQRLKLACLDFTTAPGTGSNSQTLGACSEAIADGTCDDFLAGTVAACDIKGTLARGAACGTDEQCDSGNCNVRDGQLCGTCAIRARAGGNCTDDLGCEFPLYCNFVGKCVAPGQLGAACDDDNKICLDSLVCNKGKCTAPVKEGGPCDSDFVCDFAEGLYCGANSKCQKYKVANTGQTCGLERPEPIFCSAAGSCLPNERNGTCRAVKTEGQSCQSEFDCFEPALCVGGTCRLPMSPMCK